MAESSMNLMWKVMTDHCVKVVSEHIHLLCVICHGLMIDACISNCECQFCKLCLERTLENGATKCNGDREECQRQSLVLNQSVFSDNSANIKISKLRALCPNSECLCETELGKMEKHLRVCMSSRDDCPFKKLGCTEISMGEECTSRHMESHSLLLLEVVENLRNELRFVKEELKETQLMMKKMKKEFKEKLAVECRKKDESMKKLRTDIDRVWKQCDGEEQANETRVGRPHRRVPVSIGSYLWRIENFADIKQRAHIKGSEYTNSDMFLSHTEGYTFRLAVYPNGCYKGEGTHLYICFQIMMGEFDDSLQWPFRGTLTISLVDQITRDNVLVRKYSYDTLPLEKRYLFNKPDKWNNHKYGDLTLIPLDELDQRLSLLMNDSLMVQCCVDPFNGRCKV